MRTPLRKQQNINGSKQPETAARANEVSETKAGNGTNMRLRAAELCIIDVINVEMKIKKKR